MRNYWTFTRRGGWSGIHVGWNGNNCFSSHQSYFFFSFLPVSKTKTEQNLHFYSGTFRVCSGPSPLPDGPSIPPTFILSFQIRAPGCGGLSPQGRHDSCGQTVQRVQREEDIRLALEGARPVPQQLAALQVGGDVLDADGLQKITSMTTQV